MAIRKAGDRWIVEFMFRGVRIFKRLPAGRTKGDAQTLESKLRNQIFDSVDLGKLPDPPLERVILAWGKGKPEKQKSHIRAALEAVNGENLSQIAAVRDRLAEGPLAASTKNKRISVLKAAAKWAFRKKWTARNLSVEAELLPEPKYIRREVSGSAAQKLIEAARTRRAKALVLGGLHTGMRLTELLKFDPGRDIQDGAMRVRDTKNGDDRLVPVPEEFAEYFDLFPMKSGWRNVYRSWERTRERAGVKIRFHDLRHFFGTTLAEEGYHPKVIAELMGHRSLQTTMRYTHPSLAKKREAMGAITAKLHREGGGKPRK